MSHMHGGLISVSYRYTKEKKAEERVSENQEFKVTKFLNWYAEKYIKPKLIKDSHWAGVYPDYLIFKEKQMTPDELAKKITPEGMYVYLEREEDKLRYSK